jgi:predicted dehydrogenase
MNVTGTTNTKAKLKVALIGTGRQQDVNLGQGFRDAGHWGFQHARIWALRPDVDLCAIVGRNEEKASTHAEQLSTRYYLDIAEMLDKEKPDLVSVCLPNQQHYAATLQVIQAGFPLFVEKPLVFDMAEAESLLAEADKRGLFFAINFNHRYAVPVQMAYQAVQDGRLGKLVFATWRFGGGNRSGHPHANLIETQCHGFDMLEYLCGPIESVMAEMTDTTGNGFSTMVISLKFANGAVGSLVGSYDTSPAYSDAHRVELNGTEGRVIIQDTVRTYTYQKKGSETAEVWQAGYFNDEDREFHRTFDKHVDVMLSAFRRGEAPPVHARAGYRALQLADASIRSYMEGKRIEVSVL